MLQTYIEDTELTKEMIAVLFGEFIAGQVEDLTRDKAHGKISAGEMIELLFKQKKYEVALIKIFDRIHNLQTVGVKSSEKVRKIVEESLVHFTLLLEYLEFPSIAKEIRSLCTNVVEQPKATTVKEVEFSFSFNDNYQPLSLIYRNAVY